MDDIIKTYLVTSVSFEKNRENFLNFAFPVEWIWQNELRRRVMVEKKIPGRKCEFFIIKNSYFYGYQLRCLIGLPEQKSPHDILIGFKYNVLEYVGLIVEKMPRIEKLEERIKDISSYFPQDMIYKIHFKKGILDKNIYITPTVKELNEAIKLYEAEYTT